MKRLRDSTDLVVSLVTALSLVLNPLLPTFTFFTPAVAAAAETSSRAALDSERSPALGPLTTATAVAALADGPSLDQPAPTLAHAAAALRTAPIMFVENAGQFDPQAQFRVDTHAATIYLAADALWFTLRENPARPISATHGQRAQHPSALGALNLKLSFVGANPQSRLEPFNRLDAHISYFIGNDPSHWRVDVPVWGGVRYVDLYPGLDLELSSASGRYRARLVATRSAADLSLVQIRVEGANQLALDEQSELRLTTRLGQFSLPLLSVVQPDGSPLPMAVARPEVNGQIVSQPFAAAPATAASSTASAFTGLAYSTYLGGTGGGDVGTGIALGRDGAVYVSGKTDSTNFITTTGAYQTSSGGGFTGADAFVTKFNADGTLAYSTYLGGAGDDGAAGLAVDANGNAYVTGYTQWCYFPVLNAFQPTCGSSGGIDAFVTKLNPTGTALIYSSYLGGSGDDNAYGIALDSSGNAYLTGQTSSTNFPTIGAYQPSYRGNTDAFVTKVAANGSSLVYSTYLGGINSQDISYGIAVNAQGEAYVTGKTNGFNNNDFPTTSNAYQTTFGAFQDLFMTKLDAAGSTLLYSTLLSGHDQVIAQAVAVDANGMAYVSGWSNYACNFPTTAGAYQSPPQTCTLGDTVFALKFNPAASGAASLVYSTLIGTSGSGRGHAITVDGSGAAYVSGITNNANFPTTPGAAFDSTFNGGSDVFVTKLNPSGSGLLYSTFLGGSGNEGDLYQETPSGIAVDASGAVYLTGSTTSFDFPISTNAVQPALSYNGYCCNQDAFVTMLTLPWPTSFTYNANVPEECTCWVAAPVKTTDQPINTRTGAQDYSATDLSFPALGKTMMLRRAYSSLATDLYTSTLGFGWTHNLDTRLILPTSPGGVAGQIRFKPHSANQLIFFSGSDETYTPYPGVIAQMAKYEFPAVPVTNPTNLISNGSFETCDFQYWAHTYWTGIDGPGPDGACYARISAYFGPEGLDHDTYSLQAGTYQLSFWCRGDGTYVAFAGTNIFCTDPNTGWQSLQRTFTLTVGTYGLHATLYGGGWGYAAVDGVTLLPLTLAPAPGYVITATDQSRYIFNASGQLLTWNDAQGHSWSYSYDGAGRLTRVQDSTGLRFLNLAYDAQGRLSTVGDPLGRTVQYAYDGNGDLGTVTDARGQLWTYHYDGSSHRLSEIVDPLGKTVERTEYDPATARALRQFDALGTKTLEITYNADQSRVLADALGHVMTHTYDYRGTLVKVQDANGQNTGKRYDLNFRPSHVTDPNGQPTDLTWSASGANLTKAVDAQGHSTQLGYDSFNNLTQTVDALGRTHNFTYNGTLLTQSRDALGNTTVYTYTPEGFLAAQTDARGSTTTYTVNAFGQRTSVTDALGNMTTFGYDAVGRLITTTDALGRLTVNAYDNGDQLVKVTQNVLAGQPQNYLNQYNLVTQYGYDAVGRQTLITDTLGRVTLNEYDPLGRRVKTTRDVLAGQPQNYQNEFNVMTQYGYDLQGNQAVITDTLGHVAKTDYDALNRPFKVTQNYLAGQPQNYQNQYNLVTLMAYDANGNVITRTDTLGRKSVTRYDTLNRPVTLTVNYVDGIFDPARPDEDLVTISAYDEVGNVVSTTDPAGRVTRTAYDALNRPTTVTANDLAGQPQNYLNQYNLVTTYAYDAVGNRSTSTDTLGRVTKTDYDALNRAQVVTVNYLAGQPQNYLDQYNVVTQYGYNAVGSQVAMTDTLGRVTIGEYDGLNRLSAQVDPAGQRTVYAYDALSNRVVMSDTLGHATQMTYDTLNRPITTTRPLGQVTVTQYDALGNRVKAIDPLGHATQYAYDALNRNVTITDTLGHAASLAYDALGRLTTQTDALGHATTFSYDPADRQLTVADALGNTTRTGYDVLGNRVVMTDANGIITRYGFDALSRLITVTENYSPTGPINNQTNVTTRYDYDPLGNRTALTDALGHPTTYQYDVLNRLSTMSDALNHSTSYAYDPLGRRTTLTDPKGQVTQYAYDVLSRLATITYLADNKSVKFAYDAVGNRTVMTDTVSVTRYSYDDLYRLTQVVDPFTQTISYQYDAANNRTNLTYPDGKLVTYTYNAVNLLATVKDWSAKVTTYTYDVANRLITTTLPNTVLVVNRFDNANRLTQIQQTRTTTVLSRITYTVDPVGNRTRADEYIKAVESSTGANRPVLDDDEPSAYPYRLYFPWIPQGGGAVIEPAAATVTDTISYTYDPLYRVTKANYSSPARTITYTYDAVGNRLIQGDAGKVTTYTYDIANRLSSAGGIAFTWDNNGNLLNDGKSTYTYDQANRLTKLVTGTQTYTMTYNGLNDRLTLSVNGTQTKYANDVGGGLTQVLMETTGATKNFYLYGNGLIAQQKTNVQYFGLDGLGSMRQLYNASGQIVSDRQFDPFGNQMSKTGVGTSIYDFTGEQRDASGLVFLRARYYAPGQGRFLQHDSWPGDSRQPQSLNPYAYVGNNAVNWIDPTGECYPPLDGLRKIPGEDINCANLDSAIEIVNNPRIPSYLKWPAQTYIQVWTASHAALAIGAGIVVWEVASWGSAYVASQATAMATTAPAAATTIGTVAAIGLAANELALINSVAQGDPQAQQYAFVAGQLGWIPFSGALCLLPAPQPRLALPPPRGAQRIDFYGVAPNVRGDIATVFTREQWEMIGTSPIAGDFTGLETLNVNQALARVPRSWTIGPMQQGTGVIFSGPNPLGLGPNQFRLKPPDPRYETPDVVRNYVIGRVGILFPPGDPRTAQFADQWGVGNYNDLGNLVDIHSPWWNILVHPRIRRY